MARRYRMVPLSWSTSRIRLWRAASNTEMSRGVLISIVVCGALLAVISINPAPDSMALAALADGSRFAGGPMAAPALMVLLALATFVSEDAACVAAGMLVGRGQLGFAAAVAGCGAGIFVGDLGLFLAGRIIGRPIVERWPLSRVVSPARLAASTAWLEADGARVILASRFIPGTRLVTYVAAGVLGVHTAAFVRAFATAAALWTPLLVGAAAATTASSMMTSHPDAAGSVGLLVLFLAAPHASRLLVTHQGRRRALAVWRRARRWEFWPPWVFYPPVLGWIALLMARYRSLTVFTAANPGIPAAGFVGESKSDILRALVTGGAPVAPFALLSAQASRDDRAARASSFAARHGLPLVIKPDQGQRGTGVRILRSYEAVAAAAAALQTDAIVQAYVSGVEFGVFYARRLHESSGRIVSLTRKHLPTVVGDGRRTLEQLILDDDRAVALWRTYSAANAERLQAVVPQDAAVPLCEVGSHCRGAVFLDAHQTITSALEAATERASSAIPGFFFGRFDVRSPSLDDLRAGHFTVLELNGVTSEPTHIYDPAHGLLAAYRALAASWTLAFAIGAEQAAAGARVWRVRELAGLVIGYRRFARAAVAVTTQP
jgi:membrane protein DedA with SNARE-associated domain